MDLRLYIIFTLYYRSNLNFNLNFNFSQNKIHLKLIKQQNFSILAKKNLIKICILCYQAVIEEPCSPPPILEEAEIAFGLELPPPAIRSSSSSSSGSYDLKDAMTDPNNDLEQVAPRSGHTSETELDRDVSLQYYIIYKNIFVSNL